MVPLKLSELVRCGVLNIEDVVSTPLLLLTESLSLSENDRESCNSVRPSLNIHCSVLLSR